MKKLIIGIFFLILAEGFALADGGHNHTDFEQAEAIINAEIPCESLTDEQLELVGDYYMEQMHPGEAHEAMDEMMGGEGSESLKAMHISMAESIYCGENTGMMNNGMQSGVMNYNHPYSKTSFPLLSGSLWIIYIAVAGFIFGLMFWLSKRAVIGKKK